MMTAEQYNAQVAADMTEKALLAHVRALAGVYGWLTYHTHRSDRSEPGFPDLVLAHGKAGRLMFVELKTERGRITAAQHVWLATLTAAGAEPYLWRPSDLVGGTIELALRVAPTNPDPTR